MSTSPFTAKIQKLKHELGNDLVIMGHHYQHDDVIQHVDYAKDSLQLAQIMEKTDAKHIVFCGVHFMAESACLLAKSNQNVYLPDLNASCMMAEMTPAPLLDIVIEKIKASGKNIIPLAYVNTSLAVKTIVGKHGGAVCTSANAKTMLEWAYEQGDCVLFLPDRNLGNNVANAINIPVTERHTLDVKNNGNDLDFNAIAGAKIIFWDGCCPIHEYFTLEQVYDIRKNYPEAKIYVHPETPQEIVKLCDGNGSTTYLVKMAEEAPENSTVVIGTEYNLVHRLMKKYPSKKIIPLYKDAICPDMAKITEALLCKTLEDILDNKAKSMQIDQTLVEHAKLSITRMLEHCSK